MVGSENKAKVYRIYMLLKARKGETMLGLKIITTVLLVLTIFVFQIFLVDMRKDSDFKKMLAFFEIISLAIFSGIYFMWK